MKTERHPCGCVSERERERWAKQCDRHRAETDAVRARWRAEREARQQETEKPLQ